MKRFIPTVILSLLVCLSAYGQINNPTPPGGSPNSLQYNLNGVFGGLNSPTSNGLYNAVFNVTGGVAVAPTAVLPGVLPNPQTGTTYTFLYSDRGGYVSFNNGGSIAVTLPQANTTGFTQNWATIACDIGAGTATITPTTSTISYTNGSSYTSAATSVALTTGQCITIYSDNTNYFGVLRSAGSGGSGGTNMYTTSQNASTADQGKLVIMNCSAACTYTLPATQPSSTFYTQITSVNGNATIALGGADTWYGVATPPTMILYQVLNIYANTTTSTDYRGGTPGIEGAGGITIGNTATAINLTVNATALQSVSYSATPTFEPAFGQYVIQFACTAAGGAVSPVLSGIGAGNLVTLIIVQNGTTACNFNWPSNIHGVGTVSSTLSSINVQQFVVSHNGSDAYAVSAMQTMTGGTP